MKPRYPSRFLLDIDQALLQYTHPPVEGLIQQAQAYIDAESRRLPENSGDRFAAGERVRHTLFGPGTVLDVDLDRGAHVVQFDEMQTPRRISFRARLERL